MDGLHDFWLTRLLFQRALGLVYLISFLIALSQFRPLLGEHGLLPAPDFIRQVPFRETPSLFYLWPKDAAFALAAWVGIALSVLAVTGLSERFGLAVSMSVWFLMWTLYMSFVNVGQTFYAFGWESILLEAGFYTIFLGSRNVPPPKLVIWLLRWLLFRIMFGAGMIKLRGDPCWRNLTCLDYHYGTQPMPNPLSWYFHWAPEWTHKAGVAFNHLCELVAPFGYFFSAPIAAITGLSTMVFQGLIGASGNLSILNFLTIILAIPTVSDRYWAMVLPAGFVQSVLRTGTAPDLFQWATQALAVVIAMMSVNPILNMISRRQVMNTSYNPLHICGTYGAFGSIGQVRHEVVLEGTDDAQVTPKTVWREYEFYGKPGDPRRMPPQIAPYHLRIDWLMWFAAMSSYQEHPWFVHFLAKLLQGDKGALSLIKTNPFPDHPPHFVRAELFEYHFTTPAIHRQTGAWWSRTLIGSYFPIVSLDHPSFRRALESMNWL